MGKKQKQSVEDPMTTAAAAKHFSVTARTLRNWVKSGCPCIREPGKKRPTTYYLASAVQGWLDTRADKSPKSADAQKNRVAADSADLQIAVSADALSMPDASGLGGMLKRLQDMEQVTAARYAQIMNDPDATRGEVTAYRRDWQETIDRVQKLEAGITAILVERGDYLPVAEVQAVVARTVTVLVENLDNLPTIVGGVLHNLVKGADRPLSADDYAAEIRRETQKMKAAIQGELREMLAAPAKPEEGV